MKKLIFASLLLLFTASSIAGSFSTGVIDSTARANAATAQATANSAQAAATPALAAVTGGTVNASVYQLNGHLLDSSTAPTIYSGFGTSPSIVYSNGTAAFVVNVGGGTPSVGTIAMPAAPNGWSCFIFSTLGIRQNNMMTVQGNGSSTTRVAVANVNISTTATAAWLANDTLRFNCVPY